MFRVFNPDSSSDQHQAHHGPEMGWEDVLELLCPFQLHVSDDTEAHCSTGPRIFAFCLSNLLEHELKQLPVIKVRAAWVVANSKIQNRLAVVQVRTLRAREW